MEINGITEAEVLSDFSLCYKSLVAYVKSRKTAPAMAGSMAGHKVCSMEMK